MKQRLTVYKQISFPKLNNLQPNLESTCLKLMEEAGELAQAIGKLRGLNGEKVDINDKEVIELISRELLMFLSSCIDDVCLEDTYDQY